MKQINVYFDDAEHKKLVKKKGDLNWRKFILKLAEENGIKNNTNK